MAEKKKTRGPISAEALTLRAVKALKQLSPAAVQEVIRRRGNSFGEDTEREISKAIAALDRCTTEDAKFALDRVKPASPVTYPETPEL